MQIAGILLFAYLLGSVPTGFVLGHLMGVDVRRSGSGNIGASNVGRLLGWKPGLITMLADVAKGLFPVVVAVHLNFDAAGQALTALAAFLGHLYPVFLKFRGGKGVATALGVTLGLAPWVALVLLPVFLVIVWATRWISLASLSAAVLAAPAVWIFSYQAPVLWAMIAIGILIVWRHRENIRRLLAGTESKLQRSP
ncbi:MAG TPA: glycerol-3-phosphate 1-O-acyltransferase PlsY [Candidatus Binatia bacterium]